MCVFLYLRASRPAGDLSSNPCEFNGPVLGPFVSIRLLRDEVCVATQSKEYPIQRIGDWLFQGSALFGDSELIAEDGIGPRRKRRMAEFDPFLSDLSAQDLG